MCEKLIRQGEKSFVALFSVRADTHTLNFINWCRQILKSHSLLCAKANKQFCSVNNTSAATGGRGWGWWGVNRPESLTVLMRMSSVPSVWTAALEELDIRRPSGAIQCIMGSGSPLALQRRVTLWPSKARSSWSRGRKDSQWEDFSICKIQRHTDWMMHWIPKLKKKKPKKKNLPSAKQFYSKLVLRV